MKSLQRWTLSAVLGFAVVLGLTTSGCSPKGATEMAIKASEASYDQVKDKIKPVFPNETKEIENKIAAAKADAAKGDYKTAVEEIRDVPNRVKDLSSQVEARTAELKKTWDGLAAGLPTAIDALSAQVDKFSKLKKLPPAVDTGKLETARTELATAQQEWKDAQDAQSSGNLATAIEKAGAAQQSVSEGMAALGASATAAAKAATTG